MNSYELSYNVSGVGGTFQETIRAASEQNARDLLRAKFRGQNVLIINGRQTEFGGGRNERDDRRDGKR